MQDEIKYLQKTKILMTIAIAIGIFSLLLSIVKDFVTQHWALNRDNVVCIPSEVEHGYPMVYRQTTMHPTEQDALLKSVVEAYVHYTQDEQIVDYHQVSSNENYQEARLSKYKLLAIEMSSGVEKALNMKKYSKSNDMYYTLKKGNLGWVFLIDDILIHWIPESGSVLAVVRGEYQVTYDKSKTDLPHQLWGYKEIYLMLDQGVPTESSKGGYSNKYGWFVTWSSTQEVAPDKIQKLNDRSYNYYTMRDIPDTEVKKEEHEKALKEDKEKE